MKFIVDPTCNILYASYYLKGMSDIPGSKIRFKNAPFAQLKHKNQYLCFIVKKGTLSKKIVIDTSNLKTIDLVAYDWCDIYGKVNLHPDDLDKDKIIPVGPLTAVQIYGLPKSIWLGAVNFLKGRKKIKDLRWFFSNYYGQLKRPKFSDYKSLASKNDYVYFMSPLWKKEPRCNTYRSNFIDVCKENSNIQFEGGFAPRTKSDIPGFEKNTLISRVEVKEFLEKTNRSMQVFHTPSVGECNGWRLAEYMAMGKAIISTPFKRELPGNFVNGIHFLQTDGSKKDLNDKVNLLVNDLSLKESLEKNVKEYYNNYLEPKEVIESLIE